MSANVYINQFYFTILSSYISLLFYSKEILKDVSFTVLPGQTVALVSLRNNFNSK